MALPLLVGGAECGPSNPLQGLSKRFDEDRGIQQDRFTTSGAGPSREAFRTRNAQTDADAARFFAPPDAASQRFTPDIAYDLSPMHAALPQIQAPIQSPKEQFNLVSWASDFIQQNGHQQQLNPIGVNQKPQALNPVGLHVQPQTTIPWRPLLGGPMIPSMSLPSMAVQAQEPSVRQTPNISWDKEFSLQELELSRTISAPASTSEAEATPPSIYNPDELARTAGLLLENVKDEQNPKFQQSQFMGLMRQLRDGRVVVEGNRIVENTQNGATPTHDVKGKGRAVEPVSPWAGTYRSMALAELGQSATKNELTSEGQEDSNLAYFQQDNEDYISYWNNTGSSSQATRSADAGLWDRLQEDWDQFEATSAGIKPVTNYQFQENNPYISGQFSALGRADSIFENVLALEAAVQRDPLNASAWFELGVKQQENEREQKALQALQRALELEPTYLPAWLALAVSHTNDNNRLGTLSAVTEWVNRNNKYAASVQRFQTNNPLGSSATFSGKFGHMIQCLIAMAREDTSGAIDADIQIALAVLLNTNEDYEKAQDCFRTALAVRPSDWQLYNRVGATMANSGRAEDALLYYYRALELNPGYIRARFNLGISCINLRRYGEAAQHILDALVLQDNDGVRDPKGLNERRGVTSTALWDSLKTTCLHLQRVDLATLCDRQDLEAFRNAFHKS